jgi:ribosomal protein L37AE/L43A
MRAICPSCRELRETADMARVDGIWHCIPCADSIVSDATSAGFTAPTVTNRPLEA